MQNLVTTINIKKISELDETQRTGADFFYCSTLHNTLKGK